MISFIFSIIIVITLILSTPILWSAFMPAAHPALRRMIKHVLTSAGLAVVPINNIYVYIFINYKYINWRDVLSYNETNIDNLELIGEGYQKYVLRHPQYSDRVIKLYKTNNWFERLKRSIDDNKRFKLMEKFPKLFPKIYNYNLDYYEEEYIDTNNYTKSCYNNNNLEKLKNLNEFLIENNIIIGDVLYKEQMNIFCDNDDIKLVDFDIHDSRIINPLLDKSNTGNFIELSNIY